MWIGTALLMRLPWGKRRAVYIREVIKTEYGMHIVTPLPG